MKITELNINSKLVDNLSSLGYTDLTEIQSAVMTPMLENVNILAQAQTGSGKTAAFLVPIIEKISQNKGNKALVIAPTRDLAMQIYDNAVKYAKGTGIRTGQFFGGSSYSRQIRFLQTGVDIIIGTPGRLMDLHKRKDLDLGEVNYLVLDEADQMLDMGFIDDIRKIRRLVGTTDQISFFSATMPKNVMKLVDEIMETYDTYKVESKINVNDVITQSAYLTLPANKPKVLLDILGDSKRTNQQTIIFSRTKNEASDIAFFLKKYKFRVEALHSDRSQSSRTRALKMFRDNQIQILVATNVAARGIDVKDLPLVINYNLPEDIETYVHRIGRTGRVGARGEAISFVSKSDAFVINEIEKKIGASIEMITEPKYLEKMDDLEHNIRESQVKRSKPKGERSEGSSGRSQRGGGRGGYGKPRYEGGGRGSYSSRSRSEGGSYSGGGERSSGSYSKPRSEGGSYSGGGDRGSYSSRPRSEGGSYSGGGERSYSSRPRSEGGSYSSDRRSGGSYSSRPRSEGGSYSGGGDRGSYSSRPRSEGGRSDRGERSDSFGGDRNRRSSKSFGNGGRSERSDSFGGDRGSRSGDRGGKRNSDYSRSDKRSKY
ncbi:MAG: DEAD/DEAH box helicase [Mycoplasma sp.]